MSWRYEMTTTHEEPHDRRRDPRRERKEGEPAERQDHEEFLRAVRDGGEGVGREDGQGDPFGESLTLEMLVCDGSTQD